MNQGKPALDGEQPQKVSVCAGPVVGMRWPSPQQGTMLPTFLGIGAQRAATTWAYHCLQEHPEVFVPDTKELHFFDDKFDHGLAWYESHFTIGDGHKAVGEVTPTYISAPEAVLRIAGTIPHVRLFAILREPVQRAFSAYQLLHRDLVGTSFEDACRTLEHLITRGLYAEQVDRLRRHFPRESVKIFLYDDVLQDPREVIAQLYRFLGVDPTFVPPSVKTIYNRVVFPKAQSVINRIGLGSGIRLLRRTPLGNWIKKMHKIRGDTTNNPGESVDPRLVAELKAVFREDIVRLEELIGRDLSAWR